MVHDSGIWLGIDKPKQMQIFNAALCKEEENLNHYEYNFSEKYFNNQYFGSFLQSFMFPLSIGFQVKRIWESGENYAFIVLRRPLSLI